jgi:hypothetical protein
MSWDIFISKTPVDQLEEADFESLGKKSEVIKEILEILPTANFDDPNWGNYRDDECSIEFNLDDAEKLDHLMLHVRGRGDRPIVIIKEICEKFDGYAMDGSTGEQMNFDQTDERSFQEWQDYRNKINGLNK